MRLADGIEKSLMGSRISPLKGTPHQRHFGDATMGFALCRCRLTQVSIGTARDRW